MNKQKIDIINGVKFPVIEYNGENYVPIKYFLEKVLLKTHCRLYTKEEYKIYCNMLEVDWTFKGTSIQESHCISFEGLTLFIRNCNKSKIQENKIEMYNNVCEYLNIPEEIITINNNIGFYEQYVLAQHYKKYGQVNLKTCTICNNKYPNDRHFFADKGDGKLNRACINCCNNNYLFGGEDLISKFDKFIYRNFGDNAFNFYKTRSLREFYYKYVFNSNIEITLNIEQLIEIIKEDYKTGSLDIDLITRDYILTKYTNIKILKSDKKYITVNYIIEHITDDCKVKPYKYKKYKSINMTYDDAVIIMDNYIKDNNIVIEDIFNYDYCSLCKKSKILSAVNNNILNFVVYYYKFKYPGYMFKTYSKNYYKDENMRIFDIKYLIEKDLKIDINKIPLYITKNMLNMNYTPLYLMLRKYYNNLFELIDKCYPNKFVVYDFEVNYYRDNFDSLEEAQIHDFLKHNLKNVIYNARNTERTIEINGMIPDWVIITNQGCYLAEYFGLYSKNVETSSRLKRYKNKMEIKLDKYKELENIGYKTLFIYPDDLKNNFEGLKNKILNLL